MTLAATQESAIVQPKKILIPVDGSEPAKRAAEVGVELAALYKSSVIMLSVVPSPSYVTGQVGAPGDLTEYYKVESQDATKLVGDMMDMAKQSGVEATSKVLQPVTSVVEAISEYATSEKVDLIVVGTRGLGGIKRLVLGSVSGGLTSNAPCSVLVVR
jgi:nucleotide-binding universal stress UspA family protein